MDNPYQDVVQTLGTEAVAHATVTCCIRTAKFPTQSTGTPNEAGDAG
jgi:hypothetical protein